MVKSAWTVSRSISPRLADMIADEHNLHCFSCNQSDVYLSLIIIKRFFRVNILALNSGLDFCGIKSISTFPKWDDTPMQGLQTQ